MATRVRELRDIDRLRPGIRLLGVRLKPIDILRRGEVDTLGMRSPTTEVRSAPRIFWLLMSPWTDRTIAIIAVVPFANGFRHQIQTWDFSLAWLALTLNSALLVLTMVTRRAPTRVTPNPLYWLLAFVATYWFLLGRFADPGHPLAPQWMIDLVGLLSILILVWARLSLGRNIGLVPAQRQIVTRGAYRYMRHPIYTGVFLGYLSVAVQSYSLRNLVFVGLGIFWFLIKSFVEEGFLREDPQYAAYIEHVRWRWVPGIL